MTLRPLRAMRSTIHSLRSSRPQTIRPRTSIKCFCRRHRDIDQWSRATISVPLLVPGVGQLVAAPVALVASMASQPLSWVVPDDSFAQIMVAPPADVAAMEIHAVCSMPSSIGELGVEWETIDIAGGVSGFIEWLARNPVPVLFAGWVFRFIFRSPQAHLPLNFPSLLPCFSLSVCLCAFFLAKAYLNWIAFCVYSK